MVKYPLGVHLLDQFMKTFSNGKIRIWLLINQKPAVRYLKIVLEELTLYRTIEKNMYEK